MVKVLPVEEIVKRWEIGMLVTPPLPCPVCNKLTRSDWKCQWCKIQWDEKQMKVREEMKSNFLNNYPYDVQEILRKEGFNW